MGRRIPNKCLNCSKQLSRKDAKRCSACYAVWMKGKNNPFYGKTHSSEIRKKISKSRKGEKLSLETKKRMSTTRKQQYNDGEMFIPSTRGMIQSRQWVEKRMASRKGVPGKRGAEHPLWRGGSGTQRHQAMQKIEYKLWRIAVFMRDDYTCQMCSVKGVALEADHIKPWALYPELRYAIDNGRTLCVPCHRQTDTWGNRVGRLVI